MRRSQAPSFNKKTSQQIKPSESSLCHVSNSTFLKFTVLYGKTSIRKHKVYTDDGTLEIYGTRGVLKDLHGKIVGSGVLRSNTIEEGYKFQFASKDIHIIDNISGQPAIQPQHHKSSNKNESDFPKPATIAPKSNNKPIKKFKSPMLSISENFPNDPPFKMPRPSPAHEALFNIFGKPVTDVIVPPKIARALKDYQKDGVEFLYSRLMGMHSPRYCSAILADEMGLGKTIQTIAVIHTMLKGGPYSEKIAKRALIVTPTTLLKNWENEINKWLKEDRVYSHIIDGKSKTIESYVNSTHIPLMLISYEMLQRNFEEINNINFDLMVFDEGHRLKNRTLKSYVLLSELECKKRILLTGTPFQNDIQEFFAIVDFVNPGILGDIQDFKQEYKKPIIKGSAQNATVEERTICDEKSAQLKKITDGFILRRTQEVIFSSLPKKYEVILLVRPAKYQSDSILKVLEIYHNQQNLEKPIEPLEAIVMLKKICNHPSLFYASASDDIINLMFHKTKFQRPIGYAPERSGKLHLVANLLIDLYKNEEKEKVVLVSHYTKTLSMLATVLSRMNMSYVRLDGSTKNQDRMKIVDKFNSPECEDFCFLLSAKSGGTGLNLIGASRLILYDSDWNPATDAQVCERIFRVGQKKDVFIYRLITCGTIEEKIWQRQMTKMSLGNSIVDAFINKDNNGQNFTTEEFKELFKIIEPEEFDDCMTHQLIGCTCGGDGFVPDIENNAVSDLEVTDDDIVEPSSKRVKKNPKTTWKINQLMKYEHHKFPFDHMKMNALCLSQNEIAYMFCNLSGNFGA